MQPFPILLYFIILGGSAQRSRPHLMAIRICWASCEPSAVLANSSSLVLYDCDSLCRRPHEKNEIVLMVVS